MGFKDSEKMVSAEVGAPLEEVAQANDVEIKYKCKKGECGTCQVNVDNRWVKACQTTIPSVGPGEVLNIVVKPVIHKDEDEEKAAFFSPKSFADGFFNNAVGVVGMAQGLVSDKVQEEYETRLDKEARIAELAAAKRREREGNA